jgi:hypothetical protein
MLYRVHLAWLPSPRLRPLFLFLCSLSGYIRNVTRTSETRRQPYMKPVCGISSAAARPRESRPREPRPLRRACDVTPLTLPRGRAGFGFPALSRLLLYVTACVAAELSKKKKKKKKCSGSWWVIRCLQRCAGSWWLRGFRRRRTS